MVMLKISRSMSVSREVLQPFLATTVGRRKILHPVSEPMRAFAVGGSSKSSNPLGIGTQTSIIIRRSLNYTSRQRVQHG